MPIDATRPYDDSNIFARILRSEIPSKSVYEDEHALAFHDIAPAAPVHILVIPKGAYVSWDDFSERASAEEIAGFVRAVGKVARDHGLVEPGYRLLANAGLNSGQEVPHLHVHIFAGRPLGPMLAR
ncbi:MAG TPA: histidine triad nucleotide-binding protein [Allosphingosinicella sp.]|nr:histidine triad nucleotide-binding protein [Allosphingosinicella sp.]